MPPAGPVKLEAVPVTLANVIAPTFLQLGAMGTVSLGWSTPLPAASTASAAGDAPARIAPSFSGPAGPGTMIVAAPVARLTVDRLFTPAPMYMYAYRVSVLRSKSIPWAKFVFWVVDPMTVAAAVVLLIAIRMSLAMSWP